MMFLFIEDWRDIVGYEGYYQVSSYGRVRSIDRNVSQREPNRYSTFSRVSYGKILKSRKDRDGYLFVCLSKGSCHKRVSVHRLVAETFIPNLRNLPCVNHRNEIKDDNRVENLEWCTWEYNSKYSRVSEKAREANRKVVIQRSLDGAFIREWEALTDIHKELNLSLGNLSSCCNGKRNSSGGYKWTYKE